MAAPPMLHCGRFPEKPIVGVLKPDRRSSSNPFEFLSYSIDVVFPWGCRIDQFIDCIFWNIAEKAFFAISKADSKPAIFLAEIN